MTGTTVPTIGLEEGTLVPAEDVSIRVIPVDGDRLLVIQIGDRKRAVQLPEAQARKLAELLTEEGA